MASDGQALSRAMLLVLAAALVALLLGAHPARAACPITGCAGGDPPPVTPRHLTVTINGSGTVANSGTTICTAAQSPCNVVFDQGDSVSLTATGASGQTLQGWGGACSGTGTCSLTMDANKSVTASFADTTPPAAPTITSPSAAAPAMTSTTGGATSISFIGDSDTTGFRCRIDVDSSSSVNTCTSPWGTGGLSTGTHTVYVWARDAAGNLSPSSSRSFKIVNLPDTTISGTPAESAVVASPTTAFTYGSPTGDEFICKLDGSPVACLADYGAADGTHTLSVQAGFSPVSDGNHYFDTTPATRTWTVDTHAPETSVDSGPAAATTDTNAAFGFSGADPAPGTALTYECSLDGGAYETCTGTRSYTGLAPGSHTFSVRAVDAAGNADASPATRTWSVIADADGDGFYTPVDCDDGNAAIHPGGSDAPGDGIDQDCSGADAQQSLAPGGGDGPAAPAGPTAAQIAALLRRQIAGHGKASRIHALLKHRRYMLGLDALIGGAATVKWYARPAHAAAAKRVLVATGRKAYAAAGRGRLKMKVTKAGAKLLRRSKRLKLSAIGSFTPLGGSPVKATRGFKIKR